MASIIAEWQTPDFEYREKTVSWYWLSIIVAVLILGLAVWMRNFLFGVFVVLAEMLVLVWANKQPELRSFTLMDTGLRIGASKWYVWTDMVSFDIEADVEEGWDTLTIKFHHKLQPLLSIKIPKEKTPVIEKTFLGILPKEKMEESFFDVLERLAGF